MRILHTSDWHLGRQLEGRSRLPEQEQFIDELTAIVRAEGVDLILVAGDIFDTYTPAAEAEALFFDALERLAEGGKRAVAVIAGNHDSPDRLQAAQPLAAKLGISLIGYPGEQLPTAVAHGGIQRPVTGRGWLELMIPGCPEPAVLYALPYPSESRLNQVLTESLDEQAQQIAYSERVGRLFAEGDQIFRDDTVNLVMAHLFAWGGLESDSERQLGGALAVAPGVMPKKAQYLALGHLHRPQQVHGAPQLCRYSGSPLSYSFSESDQQKEVILVEAFPGGAAQARSINLGCGKPLKRWRARSLEEARAWCGEPENLHSWVELEIMTDHAMEMAQLAEIRKLHPGIITIRPVFPELAGEAADGERLAELSLEERFQRFFQRERGITAPEGLVRFFLEMVNQAEDEEASDASFLAAPTGGEVA